MKRDSQKSALRFWFGTVGVAFLLFTSFAQSVDAQTTNTFPNTGNVGVGTMTPGAPLEVNKTQSTGTTVVVDNSHTAASNAAYSGIFFKQAGASRFFFGSINDGNTAQIGGPGAVQFWNFANGPTLFATNNAERMRIDATGNVGIGTTNPGERLVTVGNILGGNITNHTPLYSGYDSQNNVIMELGFGTATSNITPLASLVLSKNLTSPNNALGAISFANSSIANGNDKRLSAISSWTDGATNSGALVFNTSSAGTLAERMRITSTGNIGIGATAPAYKLDVQANAQWVARFKKTDATHGGIIVDAAAGYNPNLAMSVNGTIKWYMNSNTSSGDVLQFWESSGANPRFTLTQAGSVGIGTSGPGYRLDVQGGQINSSGGLCIAGVCKTAWSEIASQWTPSSSNIYYNTGNVGIGTISGPAGRLDVRQISNGGSLATLLTSYGANEDTYLRGGSSSAVVRIGDVASTTSKLLLMENGGNVGIGTTNPTAKLHVAGNGLITGNLTVDGNIAAKYQDVAEWVESSQVLAAGTVVVLDHTRSNQVIASSQAYDTRVAGVISLQPGITLGESGTGKVLVATTGRVKIKVDATDGPIQIGDLLVTSDKEGVAKKSEPLNLGGVAIHRPGTLIGKALEPLAKGTGEILVLLSLQ